MGGKRLLAYITGSVDQELLLRNEYLVMENPLGQLQQVASVQRQAIAHETHLASGVFFLPDLLHTGHVGAGQGGHQEPIKRRTDWAHTSCSSSRRSVSALR